jgi:hypothetical protein
VAVHVRAANVVRHERSHVRVVGASSKSCSHSSRRTRRRMHPCQKARSLSNVDHLLKSLHRS